MRLVSADQKKKQEPNYQFCTTTYINCGNIEKKTQSHHTKKVVKITLTLLPPFQLPTTHKLVVLVYTVLSKDGGTNWILPAPFFTGASPTRWDTHVRTNVRPRRQKRPTCTQLKRLRSPTTEPSARLPGSRLITPQPPHRIWQHDNKAREESKDAPARARAILSHLFPHKKKSKGRNIKRVLYIELH